MTVPPVHWRCQSCIFLRHRRKALRLQCKSFQAARTRLCKAATAKAVPSTRSGAPGAEDTTVEQPAEFQRRCYGCGAPLQRSESGAAGYVSEEMYQQKAKFRQLNQVLCRRCQDLCNGAMVPGVADLWRDPRQAPGNSSLATPEQLRLQLTGVRNKHAIIVLIVDLLDVSGSFMSRVRDLVGKNPVCLIGNKADLLPRGTNLRDVADWLRDTALHKRLNAFSVCLLSSRTREGVHEAASVVLRERRGRDVYILGAANVGKSAFIRALMQEMSQVTSLNFDPVAASSARRLPVESAMPGTTLRLIPLKAFSSSSALYDTPGVHFHHRLLHMLSPDELKALHPWRKLRPYIAPAPSELSCGADEDGACDIFAAVSPSATYFWGGLVRIDVLDCPANAQLVFYGPAALRVTAGPLREDSGSLPTPSRQATLPAASHESSDESSKLQGSGVGTDEASAATGAGAGDAHQQAVMMISEPVESRESLPDEGTSGECFGAASVAARGGLVLAKEVSIPASGQEGPIADIAISGLAGWVAVCAPLERGRLDIRIWVARGIEVFIRPPMPVGLQLQE